MSAANNLSTPRQNFSIEEELSPDLFSDDNTEVLTSNDGDQTEPEPLADVPDWKGVSLDEIYRGLGPYGFEQQAPITPSQRHTVLFALPVTGRGPPKPFPNQPKDKWSPGFIRMPHSAHSIYPNNHTNGNDGFRKRWEVIQEALLRSFMSTQQLETAILSYNQKYSQRWDFSALHHFFSEVVDEDDAALFCGGLLPKMIQLALQLPALVTGAIPRLKRHSNVTLSLSQLQIGSLLANAFLCTFPRRNSTHPQSEYATYPEINFNRLFSAFGEDRPSRSEAVMEKLKCIFHYFRRIISEVPNGVVTIQRRYIPKENCPRWNRQEARLPPLHITSSGTIETEGAGLLQVDFANKYVGGGVLGWGCVQEEIRFVICPELMVTMLVTEALDDTEALVVSGVERYSSYEGYSDTFKWTGDFVDQTPRDSSGRRRTSVVAIDALLFKQSHVQFTTMNIIRELNKAFVGFSSSEVPKDHLSAIATGNWGCGAFRGDPQLKVLLQLMAAAVAGRSMVYFTFGDADLRDKVATMYWHLIERNIDVGQLFVLLCENQTCASNSENSYLDFYHSLYKRCKMKPLRSYFTSVTNESKSKESTKEGNTNASIGNSSGNKESNLDHLASYTSGAKVKEDLEQQSIENWLDEDFFDEAFTADDLPSANAVRSTPNFTSTATNSEHKAANSGMNKFRVEARVCNGESKNNSEKRKRDNFEYDRDSAESRSETTSSALSGGKLTDVKKQLFGSSCDERANQAPRLSLLDSWSLSQIKGNEKTDEVADAKTLSLSNSPLKEIAADASPAFKSKGNAQKKISDFFKRHMKN